MDDLVRASGLSKGSLYWHFESKLEVFLGVFDLVMERIASGFDEIERRARGVGDAMRAQAELLVATLADERTLLRAWSEFASHPEGRRRMAEVYRWSRARAAELVQRGVECGEIRPEAAPGLPSTLTALVEGMLLQAMMDDSFDARAELALSWESLLHGAVTS